MKNILILLTITSSLFLGSCGKSGKVKLSNDKDSVTYFIGLMEAKKLKSGLASAEFDKISPEIISAAYEQVFSGDSIKISEMVMQEKVRSYFMKKQMKESAANLKEGKDFLEKNKKDGDVHVTPSGLQYKIIKAGTGPKPDTSDMVKVNYTVMNIKGEKTTTSEGREPAKFPVKGWIPGWQEALLQMNVGSKWKLFIPTELAFGERGNGGVKPNLPLIMEVELLSCEPKPAQPTAAEPPKPQARMQVKK
jgi:FKBP-type peptidyl-prolyl cis-trans isomerase FklB